MMEGVQSEAASLAGHLGLGKLIVLYDDNHVTLSGDDLARVHRGRGGALPRLRLARAAGRGRQRPRRDRARAFEAAQRRTRSPPSLIVVQTVLGYGAPDKQGTFEAHGSPLGAGGGAARPSATWAGPWTRRSTSPTRALAPLPRCGRARPAPQEQAWQRAFRRLPRATSPSSRARLERRFAGQLPERLGREAPGLRRRRQGRWRRARRPRRVLQALAQTVPELVGGSGDLDPSTYTWLKEDGDFESPLRRATARRAGRRRLGLRRAQHPLRRARARDGRGGERARLSRRLHPVRRDVPRVLRLHAPADPAGRARRAALDLRVHARQHRRRRGRADPPADRAARRAARDPRPARASARATPTRRAAPGRSRSSSTNGPTALVLTRQNVPTLDRARYAPAEGLRRGAYVLNPERGASPDVILIGDRLRGRARSSRRSRMLRERGVRVRLVSMPSWELFEAAERRVPRERAAARGDRAARGRGRRAARLGALGRRRTAPSCRSTASAPRRPARSVMKEYGFTVDHVVARALALVKQAP